jgi:hypothetical protein
MTLDNDNTPHTVSPPCCFLHDRHEENRRGGLELELLLPWQSPPPFHLVLSSSPRHTTRSRQRHLETGRRGECGRCHHPPCSRLPARRHLLAKERLKVRPERIRAHDGTRPNENQMAQSQRWPTPPTTTRTSTSISTRHTSNTSTSNSIVSTRTHLPGGGASR